METGDAVIAVGQLAFIVVFLLVIIVVVATTML